MDLSTSYLGLKLKSPLVVSACPLSEHVADIKRMEDCQASAVVLYSLFEEQIRGEQKELNTFSNQGTESFAEALSYFPEPFEYRLGPEQYLEHIRKAKAAVGIPIIASLNGSSLGGWTSFAKQIQQAGADALELNIYSVPTDGKLTGAAIEKSTLDIVKSVRAAVSIPIAVKLSPFYSNVANMAAELDALGVNGLTLFNRFYQPDIDLDTLEVQPHILLSTPQDLRLPLRWVAILHGRIKADLAATGGVHQAPDVIKLLMAGANVTMLCSALLKHGVEHVKTVERELLAWMTEKEYVSVKQMQGSMSQKKVENPTAFERAQYMKALISYKI
jgi:dihydroorotate dehydrogenase (fumarate)